MCSQPNERQTAQAAIQHLYDHPVYSRITEKKRTVEKLKGPVLKPFTIFQFTINNFLKGGIAWKFKGTICRMSSITNRIIFGSGRKAICSLMGMDDFAQKMAGEIVYIQLPNDGKTLKQGAEIRQNGIRKVARQGLCAGQRGTCGRERRSRNRMILSMTSPRKVRNMKKSISVGGSSFRVSVQENRVVVSLRTMLQTAFSMRTPTTSKLLSDT